MADHEELQAEWYQQNLLNEPKYGDITFQFDKKLVTAHSSVLSVRCGMLHKMYADAQPKKKKERKGTTNLVIAQPFAEQYPITSDTFELVLRYIYADDLQFETLSGRQALDLAIAARQFELPRLVRLCHDYLREAINLDNVHSLLKVAHDTDEAKVKGFCESFASKNRKEFIGNKAAVGEIGVELFQDVMASLLAQEEEVVDNSEVPPKTIVADFKKLYADVDMEALHGDAVVNMKGQTISFHKAFFAALSRSLAQSFQPSANGDENVTDIMKVKPALNSADSFRAILKYVYYGDISSLSVMIACEVQEFAKSHGMSELQSICESIMDMTITTESCMSIMKVVFNPGNLKRPELANTRKNSLTFFRENLVQIGLSVGDLLENGPIVMAEIILAWQIAEQAEREGIAVEDYCKRKGFDEQHRYSGINFNDGGYGAESHQEDKGDSSSPAPAPSGKQSFITASPNKPAEEEEKAEEEKKEEHHHKRGLFGGRKKDKKKDKKK